jgi:FkbM family methyltransferase
MSTNEADANYRKQKLEQLRRIQFRLDELAVLQRLALIGNDRIFSFLWRDEEMRFYLPYAEKDLIQQVILRSSNFFEINMLERFRGRVPYGATIIDAGANIGNHAVYFAKLCGAKKIFAFEPLRQTFKILQRNAELNAYDKIQCHNVALGASDGKADLQKYTTDNLGATVLRHSEYGQYPVRALDSFQFDAVDIIKLDVEGAESSVLEGARNTLSIFKPIILTEILPETGSVTDEKLNSLGYRRAEALSERDFVYCPIGKS